MKIDINTVISYPYILSKNAFSAPYSILCCTRNIVNYQWSSCLLSGRQQGIQHDDGRRTLGIALWATAWYCNKNPKAIWVGFGLSLGGIVVFTQRTIANFLSLISIIQHEMNFDAYNKSIMVVLYIMMSCTCICGLMLTYTYLPERKN